MSRVPPADPHDPALRSIVEHVIAQRGQLGELYPILLHSPPIAAGMIELGNGVRREAHLDPRLRELVICLVGEVNGAAYEVARHREIAVGLGELEARLDDLGAWQRSELFTGAERAAFAFTEALTRSVRVEDDVFDAVRADLDIREVVELTVTVAYYNMISRILVGLGIA